jgi:hypothetical protein
MSWTSTWIFQHCMWNKVQVCGIVAACLLLPISAAGVAAQAFEPFDCSEMKGAIKAISAFL